MNEFDKLSILGLIVGAALIVTSIMIDSSIKLFINLPSILITIGGSFAALLINFKSEQVFNVLKTTRNIFEAKTINYQEIVDVFTDLARKARREGLLGLEDDIERLSDPFYQKGVRLMVDALDPDLIKDILETDIEFTRQRHELGQSVFKAWGAYAPAFGMIGTLIGLIAMLANLDDPSALGPAMSVALITTFYGSVMANLVLLPMAGKLELKSDEEALGRHIILEGIIGIQSGMNPRILEEKLRSFVGPKLLTQEEREQEKEATSL